MHQLPNVLKNFSLRARQEDDCGMTGSQPPGGTCKNHFFLEESVILLIIPVFFGTRMIKLDFRMIIPAEEIILILMLAAQMKLIFFSHGRFWLG